MRDTNFHDADERNIQQWVAESAPILPEPDQRAALSELKFRLHAKATADRPLDSQEEVHIPNYQLIQMVGEGGMGSVWKAKQTAPLQRIVAIKLLQAGLERHQRRFHQEQQALAQLTHSNIAQIYDAGETPDGRPYFIMEYIQGTDLIDHCNTHQLCLDTRLDLFLKVCEAIAHSHSQGLIHRDIKPSNVLVGCEEVSDSPDGAQESKDAPAQKLIVKVIDFGLVREEHPQPERSGLSRNSRERTAENTVLGSPYWMSPEQAKAAEHVGVEIDRRTDIYSLGALLYQLVTNTPPLSPELYRPTTSQLKIIQAIQDQETESPLRRIKGLAHGRYAQFSKAETSFSRTRIRDLEPVILKALQKSPDDRYQTVSELADEIRRFLSGRPVIAQSPSILNHVHKWLVRNRQIAAATVLVASVILVLGLISLQASRNANHERSRSELAHSKVDWIEKEATEARRSADHAITKSKRLERDLASIDSLFLESLDRISPFGQSYTAERKDPDYLLQLSQRLETAPLSDQHRLEIIYKIGSLWMEYEDLVRARQILETGLEIAPRIPSEDKFRIQCMHSRCLMRLGSAKKGLKKLETQLNQVEASNEFSPSVIREEQALLAAAYLSDGRAGQALEYARKCLNDTDVETDPPDKAYLNLLCVVGASYDRLSQPEKAIQHCKRAMQLKIDGIPDDLKQIICGNNLVDVYKNAGQHQEALRLANRIVALSEKRFGMEHSKTLELHKVRATLEYISGNKTAAIETLRNTLKDSVRVLGLTHRLSLNINSDLANLLINSRQPAQAVALLEESNPDRIVAFGAHHPESIRNQNLLATALAMQGKSKQAMDLIESTFEYVTSSEDFSSNQLLETVKLHSTLCIGSDRQEESFQLQDRFIECCRRDSAERHANTISECHLFQARMAFQIGDIDRCQQICHTLLDDIDSLENRYTPLIYLLLAEVFVSEDQSDQAAAYLQRIYKRRPMETDFPATRMHANVLMAELRIQEGNPNSAYPLIALALRSKRLTPFFENYAHSLLGEYYMHSGNLQLAEKHMMAGFRNLRLLSLSVTVNSWYLPRASKRLQTVYQRLGDKDKAKFWKDLTKRYESQLAGADK